MAARSAAVVVPPALDRLIRGLILSSAVAFTLSVQYLLQPFVWRDWPLPEVLYGWVYIFRDRLIVATLIAIGVVASQSLPIRSPWLRTLSLALFILATAVAGELFLRALSDFETKSVLPETIRWTLLSLTAGATWHLWRISRATQEALEHESLRHVRLEQQLAWTRLGALRSQIEPHFLFNSLATIRHLQGVDPAAGARLMADFIDYLGRMVTLADCREVRLGDELALVRAYLAIMSVRMGERLQVSIHAPAALEDVAVPPLALATLVENAIKHGLTPSPRGGSLEIHATLVGDRLQVTVIDTGVGLGTVVGGTGIGLANTRARLATLYGPHGTLHVVENSAGGVCASLSVPCCRLAGAT